jgi:uncharacterized protein (UPF0332 family)
MSMSQEEIEALMNGLDIAEDEASDVAVEEAEDLEAVVSQETVAPEPAVEESPAVEEPVVAQETPTAQEVAPEPVEEPPAVEEPEPVEENGTVGNDDIDDLINSLNETQTPEEDTSSVDTEDIDELLASIDNTEEPEEDSQNVESEDIDDLIASLDDVSQEAVESTISEKEPEKVVEKEPEPVIEAPKEVDEHVSKSADSMVEEKIQSGVFPLPADDESKVVTQLSAVAEDSEEKATKIFDVLSFILDENMAIDGSVNKISTFLEEQEKVLQTLTTKFPNVDVFSSNLAMLNELKEEPKNIKERLNNENNELFSAMELMQYHDINRQKIERVMSVIRKLSIYLNNIFEDDNSHKEIAVAKHISGDNTEDLLGDDDLDALIAEFGGDN